MDERVGGVTDTLGDYRVRAVRSGWHRVAARLIGYRGVVLDSVFVSRRSRGDRGLRAGAEARWSSRRWWSPRPIDELLDPLATSTEQKITAADLRELPVSSLEEALAL